MEKGFRQIQCPECKKRLKFPITEKQYGQKLNIKCPKCNTISSVFIPVPPIVSQKKSEQSKTPMSGNDLGDFFSNYGKGFSDLFKGPKK